MTWYTRYNIIPTRPNVYQLEAKLAKLAINSDARGERLFLLGSEGIARGTIEGGIQVAAAVIEPNPDTTLSEEEIYKFCEEELPRYKRPGQIFFDKVPRNPTGKL